MILLTWQRPLLPCVLGEKKNYYDIIMEPQTCRDRSTKHETLMQETNVLFHFLPNGQNVDFL